MCKRSNAFSRPVLIIRGLDFREYRGPLWSFEGAGGMSPANQQLSQFPVVIARGPHLFPFRTEQLSPSAPMVLGAQAPGRVGRRRINLERATPAGWPFQG